MHCIGCGATAAAEVGGGEVEGEVEARWYFGLWAASRSVSAAPRADKEEGDGERDRFGMVVVSAAAGEGRAVWRWG